MKPALRKLLLLTMALTNVILSSCGDDKIENGFEYVYAAPQGSDTATVNQVVRTISARLQAYGLSADDYEISAADTMIKVRIAFQSACLETKIIMGAKGDVTFFETYSYSDLINSIFVADSVYSRIMGMTFDSVNGVRASTLSQYWNPTGEQSRVLTDKDYAPNEMVTICYCAVKDTDAFMEVLTNDSTVIYFPRTCKFRWYPVERAETDQPVCALIGCKTGSSSRMSAGRIVVAKYQDISATNCEVSFTMDSFETTAFQRFTSNNVGRAIAIDIDGVVWSYPTVNEAISNGTAQIVGSDPVMFHSLQAIMQGGPYPVPIRAVRENGFSL